MMVTGDAETIKRLLSIKDDGFRRVVVAVEKTAVRMANHAKAGHTHGMDPHGMGRYENQTTNLTNSIFPGGVQGQPMQWEEVSDDRVVGLFGVSQTAPGAVMEYAKYVEERYPFIFPAVAANLDGFNKELARAATGGKR